MAEEKRKFLSRERELGSPTPPGAQPPVTDLAGLQRQENKPKRSRRSVVEKEKATQQQFNQELSQQASEEQDYFATLRKQQKAAIRKERVKGMLVASLAFLFLAALIFGGRIALNKYVLEKPMTYAQFNAILDQVDLVAAQQLGAYVDGTPPVSISPDFYTVSYRVAAGAPVFTGGVTAAPCGVVVTVDRHSPLPKPKLTPTQLVPCVSVPVPEPEPAKKNKKD